MTPARRTPSGTPAERPPRVLRVAPGSSEGPFYKPKSPERRSFFEAAAAGKRLLISGFVRTTDCVPIEGAWLDFWQADPSGHYDENGFRFRGHQYTDRNGAYRLETFVPGLYPGRTRHVHVKVQRPGGRRITTELYFPEEARNRADGQFSPRLLLQTLPGAPLFDVEAKYDFILG